MRHGQDGSARLEILCDDGRYRVSSFTWIEADEDNRIQQQYTLQVREAYPAAA